MIRAVIIGTAHMHANEVALYIHEQDGIELVGCADLAPEVPELPKTRYTRAWNLENIRENYCSKIYGDYRQMLDEVKPDIAFILCETNRKHEVVLECAKRKINISIEKPMEISYEEALKIKAAVDENGIEAIVNWPLTWRDYLHRMKAALDTGIIGDLIKIRFLIGNTGPVGRGAKHRGVSECANDTTDEEKASMWWYRGKCGGGSLLDFCSYGCMYSTWLNGSKTADIASAVAVNGATKFADICDNAATLLRFGDVLAVLEGTWATPSRAIDAGPTLYGSEGVMYCERGNDGKVEIKAYDIYGNDLEVPEFTMPEYRKNIASEYMHHVNTGEPVHETLQFDFNLKVMSNLDAASRSSKSGRAEIPKK